MNETGNKPKRDRAALQRLLEAYRLYLEQGMPTIRCDQCEEVIKFHQLGDEAYASSCDCGKYDDTLRGI